MNQTLHVAAVGLAAPGLAGWDGAQAVLRGAAAYAAGELPPHQTSLLPPNERRRAPPAVRLAFRAAEDAMAQLPPMAEGLATVFASSDADMDIIHRICSALSNATPMLSPTDFHNSVHNAAAGYWSIAVKARGPSSTLSAYDASFAAGLLEAAAQVQVDGTDTMLVTYDVPPPFPLNTERPIGTAVAVALVLSSAPGASLARLRLESFAQGEETSMADPALEALRRSNPAGRALPLLRLLALRQAGSVLLDNNAAGLLRVEVLP
jgi:hypothetical protein